MPLTASSRAPGLFVGDGVAIDPSAQIGVHVVLHDGTVIGPGCVIDDHAVIGKRPHYGTMSRASSDSPEPVVVDAGAYVGTGAILFAGARVCRSAYVADQATLRERSTLGPDSMLGRGSRTNADATIGARVRIQDLCGIATAMVIEDDVFIGPRMATVNDNSMGAGEAPLSAPVVRRGARIGAQCTLFPGVEVGAGAIVGAHSLVTHDVPPRMVVMGVPARVVRAVG